jgi:hypothetical protein
MTRTFPVLLVAVWLASSTSVTHAQAPSAETSCNAALLTAGAITARDLQVSSPSFPASRCLGVNVGPLEIAPPVPVPGATACEVAVLHRRTIVRTELCGNDVHFEPIVEIGVVVLRRSGTRWIRIARGRLDVEIASTAVIEARDTDADGRAELVLDGRLVLAIQRRRVSVLRTLAR